MDVEAALVAQSGPVEEATVHGEFQALVEHGQDESCRE